VAKQRIKAVVIGGGTGSFTVLTGLKAHPSVDLTAIVNMVDDGGSTGVLRDELGVLPPGDVRQCLVALSPESNLLRDLMNYRYESGSLGGHAFGNLLLAVLEKITGGFGPAVKAAEGILATEGRVIPVTTDDTRLCVRLKGGKVRRGQGVIERSFFKVGETPRLFLSPKARLNPEARRAINEADLIVFGPGNIYSSLIPNLLVHGMPEALGRAKGKRIYVCNLVTEPGQTPGHTVSQLVDAMERYAGREIFDFVLYDTARPETRLLKHYRAEGQRWVESDPAELRQRHYKAVGASLLSRKPAAKNPGDTLWKRNLIRHDAKKLASQILKLHQKK
jgi:uncharacterized cofD-like protein